jgi:pyrimidine operon attenuation protein/uracil phosphoribosyltransferase
MNPLGPPGNAPLVDSSSEVHSEVMDAAAMGRVLRRMAYEIVERAGPQPYLVGIRTGGAYLAERIVQIMRATTPALELGVVDITLYRDDALLGLPKPEVGTTELPAPVDGRNVVLVDDVLFTGRTVRAAMDVLLDYGRPNAIQLAVLVDRGCRELPIQPDYAGVRLQTTRAQSVRVQLAEKGETDRVVLREKSAVPAGGATDRAGKGSDP